MQSYLGVTIHYKSNNGGLESGNLGVFHLYQNHTAEYIADSLSAIISDFNLDPKKITAIVSDGAANIKKAVSSVVGKEKHIVCFAHVVSHLVKDALTSLPAANSIITKIKNIVTLVRRSTVTCDELKRLQIRDGKTQGTALPYSMEFNVRDITKIFRARTIRLRSNFEMSECS